MFWQIRWLVWYLLLTEPAQISVVTWLSPCCVFKKFWIWIRVTSHSLIHFSEIFGDDCLNYGVCAWPPESTQLILIKIGTFYLTTEVDPTLSQYQSWYCLDRNPFWSLLGTEPGTSVGMNVHKLLCCHVSSADLQYTKLHKHTKNNSHIHKWLSLVLQIWGTAARFSRIEGD